MKRAKFTEEQIIDVLQVEEDQKTIRGIVFLRR